MISRVNIQTSIQRLDNLPSHELKIEGILRVYLDLFPVLNAMLMRFSPLGYLGEGILSMDENGIGNIRDVRDDIRSIPAIYTAIRERKSRFVSSETFFQEINSKYINTNTSCLIVPILSGNTVVGYICSNVFPKDSSFQEDLLSDLTFYGKMVGQILEISSPVPKSAHLSKRELEVMR